MRERIVAMGVVLFTVVGATGAGGQVNPTHSVWVDLPQNTDLGNGGFSNNTISELTMLDVLVGGRIRVFYTTQGAVLQSFPTPGTNAVRAGALRPIDFPQIPDLDLVTSPVAVNGPWTQGVTPIVKRQVANWNKVLQEDVGPAPHDYGKRGSLNGMIAKNGYTFSRRLPCGTTCFSPTCSKVGMASRC